VTVQSPTTEIYLPYLEFDEEDDTFPYRLVLGKLVDASTPEQIKVYDEVIKMSPEYSFYSGVASGLGLDAKLEFSTKKEKDKADKKYLKKSLAWMMALARVELGATMSMYGETDDPFGAVASIGGAKFGAEEFLEILVDDLTTHLKAIQQDNGYQNILHPESEVDASSLAYLRRTQLINDMLTKVASSDDARIVALAKPYAIVAQQYTHQMVAKVVEATTPQAIGRITFFAKAEVALREH